MFTLGITSKLPVRAASSFPIFSQYLVPGQRPNFVQLQKVHTNTGKAKVPRLVYVQNPLSWLRNKVYMKVLKYTWDRQFDESEFKRGATQVYITCHYNHFLAFGRLMHITEKR